MKIQHQISRKIQIDILLSILFGIVITSYFERVQVEFFMPLRNLIMVPSINLNKSDGIEIDTILPYKASKDGYYINPWQASSIVNEISEIALSKGCDSLSEAELIKLKAFGLHFANNYSLRKADNKKIAAWEYPISYSYNTKPGWISGMSQARISKVLKASSKCEIIQEARVLLENTYELAINSFYTTVENGGVSIRLSNGLWFEEYAQPGVEPPQVLNGHIYAVLDLYTLSFYDEKLKYLVRNGLESVKNNMDSYDAILWSYYDKIKTPANNIYQQRLHTRQMLELFEITKDPIFLHYHKKFQSQLYSPISSIQRLYLKFTNFLAFLIVFNTLAAFLALRIIRKLHSK